MASMRLKFTVLVSAFCGVAMACIVGVEATRQMAEAEATALERQESSLRTVAMALDYALDEVSVRFAADGSVERVEWTQPPSFGDHALIDRVGGATGETATIFVLDPADGEFWRRTTNILKPDGQRAVGTPLGKTGDVHAVVARGEVFSGEAAILGSDYYTIYAPIHGPSGVEGVLFVGAAKAGVNAAALATVTRLAFEASLVLLLAAGISWLAAGRALGGLGRLEAAMHAMRDGDFRTAVPETGRNDEIGELARGFDGLREALSSAEAQRVDRERERVEMLDALEQGFGAVVASASGGDLSARVETSFAEPAITRLAEGVNRICGTTQGFLQEVETCVTALADGDLRQSMKGSYGGQFAQVAGALNTTIDRLGELIVTIQNASEISAESVTRIESGARDLSGRAENQAASLEETAATMEEMAASVKSNAAALLSADKLAGDVDAKTADGAATVEQAVEAVNRIKTSSDKITDIISMIESIAWQTNLLALNASVEAARAGEAGRGFAVVASEVRALAQRAAEAARDITGLIQTSAENVQDGIAMVEKTGSALRQIRDAMGRLTSTLGEVSAASREQATGVEEINSAVSQMDRITQENAALTDRFASEAATLAGELGGLQKAASVFKAERRARMRSAA